MATSHGLSPPFTRPSSTTNHESNIFIPSLSNTTASLKSPTDCQFSSLEELLSATGIPTDSQQQQPPLSDTSLKRPLLPDRDEAAASPKRPRLSPSLSSSTLSGSSSTLSASLSSTFSPPSVNDSRPSPVPAQGLIPSILAHSSSNHSKLPTILPASTTQSVLPAVSNSLSLPAVTSLSSTLSGSSIIPQLSTTINASMALLAQLFRQYQAIGDETGMQKTRQQLLSLIAKTSNKPASSDQPVTLSLSIPNSAASTALTSMPALAPQLTNSTTVTSSSGAALSNSSSLLSSTPSLLPLATSKPHSPSIVTQPPPPQSSSAASTSLLQNVFPLSAVAGSNKSLPSLHITPQTQTNIMRAVYSYRLKQIQDFISSLPPQQRPTTTQGLRDLLVKHNMAAKLQTIPQSLLVQLQQSSQTSSSTTSTTGSILTTSDAVSAATPSTAVTSTVSSRVLQSTPASQPSVQLLPGPTTTPQTVSLTASSSTPSTSSASPVLPGVTVETLRTLCRLPSNSLSRIPMHRTLMGIVQYLRARGWAGNRVELPALLQQAQEAVNKGQLTSQQQQTLSTTTPSTQQQAAGASSQLSVSSTASSLLNSRPSATSSSPLSQYMASVGMKVPRTDLGQTTPTGVRPYNNAYTRNSSMGTSSGLLNRAGTSQQAATPSGLRPFTRYQLKVQQERVEHERLAALQKVLQSSEEARIAFRFQAHMEKLHQQLCAPDAHRGFSSNQDVVLRLVPYHVWAEPELPPGAVEKADAVYEGIASVLLSRAQGLMSRYDQCILRDEEYGGETEPSAILLERLFLEGERERKEEEERQRRAEEAATTGFGGAGHVADGSTSHTQLMSTDPFLMDSDPFSDDPFLPHFWSPDLSADLGTGIT